MTEKEKFTEALCKVLAHEDPEVVLALLRNAGIIVSNKPQHIFSVVQEIRDMR